MKLGLIPIITSVLCLIVLICRRYLLYVVYIMYLFYSIKSFLVSLRISFYVFHLVLEQELVSGNWWVSRAVNIYQLLNFFPPAHFFTLCVRSRQHLRPCVWFVAFYLGSFWVDECCALMIILLLSCCTLTWHTHKWKPPNHVIKSRLSACVMCIFWSAKQKI